MTTKYKKIATVNVRQLCGNEHDRTYKSQLWLDKGESVIVVVFSRSRINGICLFENMQTDTRVAFLKLILDLAMRSRCLWTQG